MIESVVNSNQKHPAIRRIQWFTIGWMTIEVAIALVAAIRAPSVALAAFGGDSAIELLSADVVLGRFRATRGISEGLSTKITAWLLVALAAYIALHSLYILLAAKSKPEPSYWVSGSWSLQLWSCLGWPGANDCSQLKQVALHCEMTLSKARSAATCPGSRSRVWY